MNDDEWYFAYGSNLNRPQKERRTGAIREARICRLPDYRLAFNKRHSKWTRAASILPSVSAEVWGVAYRMNPAAFAQMDQDEGVPNGHYRRISVSPVERNGRVLTAIAYVAGDRFVDEERRPHREYLDKILSGAREQQLPEDYVESIERFVASLPP